MKRIPAVYGPIWKPGAISVDAPNHYEVLGVAKDATPDEIRAAHRRLVYQVHTDKGVVRMLGSARCKLRMKSVRS